MSQSDQSKIPRLADLGKESNSPFICLTETHLNPDILDVEIQIDGYNLFRSDRLNRSHGGVCIYVRKDLAVKSELKDSNSFCDSLILHIPQLNLVITTCTGHQTVLKHSSFKIWSMQHHSLDA